MDKTGDKVIAYCNTANIICIQNFYYYCISHVPQYMKKFKAKYETTGHRFVTKIINLDNDSWNQSSVAGQQNKPN